MIRTLDRYLGLAARGSYLSYCLIVDETLRKVGAISLRCDSGKHASRICEAFSMLRTDLLKTDNVSATVHENICFVGMCSDLVTPRSALDARRQYNHCRIRTMVECQSDSIFGTKPIIFKERELFHTIARITDEKISSAACLEKCCRKRFTSLLSVDPVQFNGIAIAWATAVCLKRKLEIESMKLDATFMERVESKIKQDKIVLELVETLEKEKDEKIASELQESLKSRINTLANKLLERLV